MFCIILTIIASVLQCFTVFYIGDLELFNFWNLMGILTLSTIGIISAAATRKGKDLFSFLVVFVYVLLPCSVVASRFFSSNEAVQKVLIWIDLAIVSLLSAIPIILTKIFTFLFSLIPFVRNHEMLLKAIKVLFGVSDSITFSLFVCAFICPYFLKLDPCYSEPQHWNDLRKEKKEEWIRQYFIEQLGGGFEVQLSLQRWDELTEEERVLTIMNAQIDALKDFEMIEKVRMNKKEKEDFYEMIREEIERGPTTYVLRRRMKEEEGCL